MTDEQLALARRAVACRKWWAWMPGMRDAELGRVIAVHEDEIVFHDCRVDLLAKVQPDSPDLTDHATLGCLLALVREAWGDKGLHCAGMYSGGDWLWHVHGGKPHGATFRRHVYAIGHGTEAEALVAALEAAPC